MRRIPLAALVAAAAALVLVAGASSKVARPVTSHAVIAHWDGTAWSLAPGFKLAGSLDAVTTLSATDAWAVGNASAPNFGFRPVAEHWDGSSWSTSPVKAPGQDGRGELYAVAGTSAKDVWAVGYSGTATSDGVSLIEHWNGKAWRVLPSPNPGSIRYLTGVAALSPRNAWAVGWYANYRTGTQKTFVLHWTGKAWLRVPSPNVGTKGYPVKDQLLAVTAVSARDVWAVGDYKYVANGKHAFRTLVLHWNGRRWRHVASPNPHPRRGDVFMGVASSGAGDVWAVGSDHTGHGQLPLIEHWSGGAWKLVPANTARTCCEQALRSVAAVSSTAAWTAGDYANGSPAVGLLERWDGTAWSRDSLASPDNTFLRGIAASSTQDVWAVGFYQR